jgi:hypothetical protein
MNVLGQRELHHELGGAEQHRECRRDVGPVFGIDAQAHLLGEPIDVGLGDAGERAHVDLPARAAT